jgi:hypothetical protein
MPLETAASRTLRTLTRSCTGLKIDERSEIAADGATKPFLFCVVGLNSEGPRPTIARA